MTPLVPSQAAREAAVAFFPERLWKDETRADLAAHLARFEQGIREDERERCAKVAEDAVTEVYPTDEACRRELALAVRIATAIRKGTPA